MITRRRFLQGALCVAAGSTLTPLGAAADPSITWTDVTQSGVEGRGWQSQERKRYFDRLPAKAESAVRKPVWDLSRHSAGMAVRFRTNATKILVDYELLSDELALPHMPATGVSGVDLYGQTEQGRDRWIQVVKPTQKRVQGVVAEDIDPGSRIYTFYLPLYNGVESFKVGVPSEADFESLPPREESPILFYGTSIMHGACASRPGMAIPAILGRRLNRPTINLGFSGNGRMEPEVAELLAELNVAAYCIDCLPNMNPNLVQKRVEPFVRILRAAHSHTPVVLVEDRVFANATFHAARRKFHRANHAALRTAYQALSAAGVEGLHYLPGDELLGHDGEATTDGSHPNDLGFMRYADAYETALRAVLG